MPIAQNGKMLWGSGWLCPRANVTIAEQMGTPDRRDAATRRLPSPRDKPRVETPLRRRRRLDMLGVCADLIGPTVMADDEERFDQLAPDDLDDEADVWQARPRLVSASVLSR